jgi:hypothetical protein
LEIEADRDHRVSGFRQKAKGAGMMRSVLLSLVLTSALYADCTASVFPSQTASMRFVEKSHTAFGDTQSELTWSDRRIQGNRIQWTQTYTVEDQEPRRGTSQFRCTDDGITPVDEGTDFTGAQYGNRLERDATWKWTWAGKGISGSYDYRVIGNEQVTVPAGTFDAVRVDYTAKILSQTRGELPLIHGSLWIAKGVGLIKQFEDDPSMSLVPQKTTLELVEVKKSK